MIESIQRIKYLKTLQNSLRYSWPIGKQIRGLTQLSFLWKFNIPIEAQEDFLMKKICLLLVMLLITSVFSGCIGQEQNSEVNNTTTPSYNSTQNRHPSFWSMMFWSSLWSRYITPGIQAAKYRTTPDAATKKDASTPSKKVDAKDPTETANKKSVSPDSGNKPKPRVKTTTTRIRRSGRR